MSIILGDKTITDIYLGDKAIVNGWVGDKLVFGQTEGVWWERHKWLVGKSLINKYFQYSKCFSIQLISNDSYVNRDFLWISGNTSTFSIYQNGKVWSYWYKKSSSIGVFNEITSLTINREKMTYQINDGAPIALNVDSLSSTFQLLGCSQSPNTWQVGIISIDDTLSYVPCELIKAIPKCLSTDSIKHAAGSCGLWGLRSDMFTPINNSAISDED